jgi:hypothetical protein
MPISEGSLKYLKSDRDGYRLKGGWRPLKWINIGGEYEDYDTLSTNLASRRGQLSLSLTNRSSNLTFRDSKLTSSIGTTSKLQGVTMGFNTKASGPLGPIKVTAGWMNVDFTSHSINSSTKNFQFAVSGTYRKVLILSVSLNAGDSEEANTSSSMKSETRNASLKWIAIPEKLVFLSSYDSMTGEGLNTDKQETRGKLGLKYTIDEFYTLNLAWERLSSQDDIFPAYNYSQNILRIGVEMDF